MNRPLLSDDDIFGTDRRLLSDDDIFGPSEPRPERTRPPQEDIAGTPLYARVEDRPSQREEEYPPSRAPQSLMDRAVSAMMRNQPVQQARSVDRRSIAGDLRVGAQAVGEGLVSGVGRTAQILGAEDRGERIAALGEAWFGLSEDDSERSQAIREANTLWENVIDGAVQGAPSFAASIAAGLAGGRTGAMIGGAFGGPKGALAGGAIGAAIGAGATIFPMMVHSAWQTAEGHGADTDETQTRVSILGAAIATTAIQTVAPAYVSNTLLRVFNRAGEQVARNVIGAAAGGGAIVGISEGLAEAAAVAIEQIVFDPQIREAMTENDWRAIAPLMADLYGEDMVIAFGAGMFLGSATGAAASAGAARPADTNLGAIQEQRAMPPEVPPADQEEAAPAITIRFPNAPQIDETRRLADLNNEIFATEQRISEAEAAGDDATVQSLRQTRETLLTEAEAIESPIPTEMLGGVTDPLLQPPAAIQGQRDPVDLPATVEDDARWLLASGYTAEQITDMAPAERAQEAAEARDAGIAPVSQGDAVAAILAAQQAQQSEGAQDGPDVDGLAAGDQVDAARGVADEVRGEGVAQVAEQVVQDRPADTGDAPAGADAADSVAGAVAAGQSDAALTPEPSPARVAPQTEEATNEQQSQRPAAQGQELQGRQEGRAEVTPDSPASWVVRERATGEVVMETFDRRAVNALNTDRFEAVPIRQYLGETNAAIREAGGVQPAAAPRPAVRAEPEAQAARPAPLPSIARQDIRSDTAVTSRGREVPVTYAVVEASSLVPSQLRDGRRNPAYPQDLQPRDRSRATSQEQIRTIARNLQPRLLGENPQASAGAPIISPDGVVESGNGRTLALQQAYADRGDAAQRYRDWLGAQGYPVDGMSDPVLVRVRQGEMTPEDRRAFTREANERDTQAMSVSEQAMADAQSMSQGTLSRYRGGDIDAAANRDFVRAFLSEAVGEADRGSMIAPDGSMSQDAVRRVQAALLARAYGDAALISNLMEGTDTSIKGIGGALTDVAAQWAQMRELADNGTIDPSVDQTAALLEAVRLVDRARREGRKVAEFIGQTDMFSGDSISGMGRAFLDLFFRNRENYTQPVARDKLAGALRLYVSEAEKTVPGTNLLGQTTDPQAIAGAARRFLERQYDDGQGSTTNLFAQPAGDTGDGARDAGTGRDRPSPATAETGVGATTAQGGRETPGPEAAGVTDRPRFSRRETPTIASPLYVAHNLSEQNLAHVVDLGGLAAPSLAIARGDIGFENFGEITLVGGPEMADPRRPGVRAFNADVYSPRQPRAQYDINGPEMRRMNEVLGPSAEALGERIGSTLYPEKISREGLAAIAESDIARLAFLKERGIAPRVAMLEKKPLDARLRRFRGSAWEVSNAPGFEQAAIDVVTDEIALLPENARQRARERWLVEDGGETRLAVSTLNHMARQVAEFHQPPRVDRYETGKRLRERIEATKKRQSQYLSWVEDRFGGVLGAQFFTTSSGRRRPYKMDDIVREMTRIIRDGEGFNYGVGSIRSMVARPFRSIADIQKSRDSIIPQAQMDALKNEVNGELEALSDRFAEYHESGKDFGWLDIFSEFLKDLSRGNLREWQNSIFSKPVPEALLNDARQFLDRLRDMPTEYFEVKMQRPVALSEFTAAIVPKNTGKDTIETLRAAGLRIVRYDRSRDGARNEALQQVLPSVAFSRRLAPEFTTAAPSVEADLNARLERIAPGVKLAMMPTIQGQTEDGAQFSADGHYLSGLIAVALDADVAGTGTAFTLNHEVVHALRDSRLWGRETGLFKSAEWRTLERAARADTDRMASVRDRYSDLSQEAQVEEAVADMYADWAAGRMEVTGFIRDAFRRIQEFFEALGNALRGNGFDTAESVFARIEAGEVGARGQVEGDGQAAPQFSRPSRDTFATEIMSELAQVDDLFRSPRSSATQIGDLFSETAPEFRYIGAMSPQDVSADAPDAQRHLFRRDSDGVDVFVFEGSEGDLWFDVSRLGEGSGGNRLYAAMGDFAHNTGKRFIGDPEGLSDIALRRRTDAMLSSALKHGTTEHLAPHDRQSKGDDVLGVPALRWTDGDHLGNIQSLIDVSVESLAHHVPEIRRARYDFQSGAFRTGEGKPIADGKLAVWSGHSGVRAAGAGRSSLKRAILLNTLARTESSQRPGLLERSLRQQRELVKGLSGTLYNRRGTFSPEALDVIRAANARHAPPQQIQQMLPATFAVPARTPLIRLREAIQDKFIAYREVERAIAESKGAPVPESQSFYLKSSIYEGRTNAALQKAEREDIQPIYAAMREAGLSVDDVGLFMLARHAPERNAMMARRDPERFDAGNGSGLETQAAREIIANFRAKGKEADLTRVADLVEGVLKKDLRHRLLSGLISQQEYDDWSSMYQHYVPLRGFAERDDGDQTGLIGRGFDIRGSESKTALGRTSLPENPLVMALSMRTEGIVRAEKNRAGRALLRLVQANPNPGLWEVMGKLPMRRVFDPESGMVKRVVDTGAVREDDVISVKIGGKAQYIRIHDPLMVQAYKNLGSEQMGAVMRLGLATTRFFSRMQTAANPDFVFPNGMSDMLEGVWTAYNADKKGMTASYAKNYPLALALAMQQAVGDSALGRKIEGWTSLPEGIQKRLKRLTGRDLSPAELSKLEQYRVEWQESGGQMTFMGFKDMAEITADINREIREGAQTLGERAAGWVTKPWTVPLDAARGANNLIKVIETINGPVENAGRLAMYISARENGFSKDVAASMSLDSSGNYYRRGNSTRAFQAWTAFFNPAVQGIEKFARFAKRPKNLAILGGVVTLGYVQTLLNGMMWGDDDDPEGLPLYLAIPEYERQRSIIIPYGVETVTAEDGTEFQRLQYYSWRVPHNLRMLLTLGSEIASTQMGWTTPGSASASFGRSVMMNNNPMGDANLPNLLAPTALDPMVDIWLNRSAFTDAPIRPQGFFNTDGIPQSSQYFERSTSPVAVGIAQGVNAATGGDDFTPGLVDLSPNDMEYLFDYWVGGLGRFVQRAAGAAQDKVAGIETDPAQVPLARSFRGATSGFAEQQRYYTLREDVLAKDNRLGRAWRMLQENPDEATQALFDQLSWEMNVSVNRNGTLNRQHSIPRLFRDADSELRGLREEWAVLQNSGLSRYERVTRQRALRLEMESLMRETRAWAINELAANVAAIGGE